jgi:hypothetical protein
MLTNWTCLRAGCHSWYQSHYGYNISPMTIFAKTMHLRVRIWVYVHIRTIVVLTSSNATGLLSAITFRTKYSITTHLWPGKNGSDTTECGETLEAHPVWGRGLGCSIQQSVREVIMSPWKHMKTSRRVMWISDPSAQDMACLRTICIVGNGLCVCHVTNYDRTPRVWGPRNVPWTPSMGSEYVLVTYATLTPLRG